MKKTVLTVLIATAVAICSLQTTRGQELTKEQLAAEQLRELEALQAQAAIQDRSTEFWKSLTPEQRAVMMLQRDLVRARIKNPPMPTNPPPKIKPQSMTASMMTASSTAGTEESDPILEIIQENGSGYQQLGFGSCGSDPNAFYNLPLFDAPGGWFDQPAPPAYIPWYYLIPNEHDQSGRAAIMTDIRGSGAISSQVYTFVTNDFDMYGVPLRHRLSFSYIFTRGPYNDTFRLEVGNFVTNLPVAGSWTRKIIDIPMMSSAIPNPEIRFALFQNFQTTTVHPYAALYAPQWCTEVRPTDVSLKIRLVGTNVLVSWSHENAPTNYWSLTFSQSLNGPWSTAIGTTPIVYSNTTAIVTLPANNSQRNYRLKRN